MAKRTKDVVPHSTETPDQKGLHALSDIVAHYVRRGSRFEPVVVALMRAKDLATNLETTDEDEKGGQ